MSETSYYAHLQPHQIDPERVSLFKIRSQGTTGNWYVRIRRTKYKTSNKRYFQQSLKTRSLDIAKQKASLIYLQIRDVEDRGREFTNKRFSSAFEEFLNDGLTAGKGRRKRFESTYIRYWLEFFGDIELSQLTTAKFNDYLRWRSNYWEGYVSSGQLDRERDAGINTYHYSVVPRTSTLKTERQMIKQFLFWCNEREYISVVPQLKTKISGIKGVKSSTARRKSKALTEEMERTIEMRLRDYCLTDVVGSNTNWLKRFGRRRLYYFTYFARHSLIRPNTELTHLKWSDIEIMESKKHDGKQLALLRVTNAKGGKERMAVMPYGQVNLIYRWRDESLAFNEELGESRFGGLNDYVFPSYRGGQHITETHLIARLLRHRLKDWGLSNTEDGLSVTLYSIARHTGITRRIERSNWDVGRVATSAGTSIQQISQFYYEAFIRQNPDRWAMTFRNGKPYLSERKQLEQEEGLSRWEEFLDGHQE